MALSSLTVGPSAGVVVTGSLSPSLATLGSLELAGGWRVVGGNSLSGHILQADSHSV